MTNREKYAISNSKNKAYKAYIELCINLKEVPKEEILLLIDGCTSFEALRETTKIFQSRNL